MNQWDRDNYDFIMSLTDSEFDSWYDALSEEDRIYALELMILARSEKVKVSEVADISSLELAQQVLAQFTLSKKVKLK